MNKDRRVVSKVFTQRVEHNNLNFLTRLKRLLRKTICFLKSSKLHDKLIVEFISRERYQLV
ncbi:MAG: IS1 family transposase [Endozoicomonas sp. (ex Botrylloides leachii)]|nr:IS1 family transposase [Endozoicomonas sp. (ex Botrylloides leachii)]